MQRWTLLALGLLSVAITIVALFSASKMSEERSRLVLEFARERFDALTSANESIVSALNDIDEDIHFVGEMITALPPSVDPERVLTPVLAVVKPYRLVQIYDDSGERVVSVTDPTWGEGRRPPQDFDPIMKEAAAHALEVEGEKVYVSHADERNSWFRAFARRITFRDRPASIVLLVETELLFGKLAVVGLMPATRLLVLGPHGQPTAPSDPLLKRAADRFGKEAENLPMAGLLAQHLRNADSGTMVISEPEAEMLGLGKAELVAAFAPIPMRSGEHYQVAAIASTSALKAQARSNMLHLLLTSGTIGLLIAAFGFYTVVAQTKAIELRERVKHADRLAHLHEKTDKILDHIPAGVAVLSRDIKVTAVNRALRDMMPDPSAALADSVAGIFPKASPQIAARIRDLLASALSSEKTKSIIGELIPLLGRPGRYSIHAVPLEPRFPEARLLLFIEDLSAVELLTEQLLRAEKHATVGVLAAGVAHEIGTPLGIARARAEYLMKEAGPDSPHAQGAKVIVDQIDLVSRTIRQLLDFSRVQSPVVRPIEVQPIARAVHELLRFEAERRKLEITIAIDDSAKRVAADPDQLQQVLVNLALNACDACSAGGHVRISASTDDGGSVRIAVEDDGCGIPPENKRQIFDPFFTTKKRGQGTGLGLTIVSQIVRNHGARIEVESEPGHGARFVIFWPAASAQPAEERRLEVS